MVFEMSASTSSICLYGMEIVISLLLIRVTYSLFFHSLSNYPGPLLARMGLLPWGLFRFFKGDTAEALIQAHEEWGDWVRIGFNEVSTCDPVAISIVYPASKKWLKTPFYSTFRDPSAPHNLFSAINTVEHSNLRRMNASAYTLHALLKVEGKIQEQASSFVRKLNTLALSRQPLDFSLILRFLAWDVVGALAFGGEDGLGMIRNLEDQNNFLPAVATANEAGYLLGSMSHFGPALWALIGKIGGPLPAIAKMKQQATEAFLKREGKGHIDETADMLSYFAKAKNSVTGQPATLEETFRSSVLAAGSDTTSTAMGALIMYVLTTEGVYEKLLAEIDDAFETRALSNPPTYAQSSKLVYFQACVKEALRVWPAVAWVMSREAPKGGGSMGNRFFPAGTSVGVSSFTFHRRCTAFGDSPELFRPERWLEASKEQRKEMKANFLSFGAGSRICIGRNISMLEISVVMPLFFHNFSISLIPRSKNSPHKEAAVHVGAGGKRHTWHIRSTWFALQSDMWVTLEKRNMDFEL